MRAKHLDSVAADEEEPPFEMANLYPRDTGLPMTVWVSPKGKARHDVRIKVCTTPGNRMDADNTAVVAVRPSPRVVHGELTAEDLKSIVRWIARTQDALIGYWNGDLSTVELARGLKRI